MRDILKLARIQIVFVLLFILLKIIRPSILNSNSPELFKTISLSLPNFFEAVIGTLIITGIGLYLNMKLLNKKRINLTIIYILAPIIAAVYVLTQELKIHNLGGENVFDKNDMLFSVIGLLVSFLLVLWIKPKIYTMSEDEGE